MTRLQSDEALLDCLQHTAFDYFLHAVNPANGLVADSSRGGAPASIAVVGFALACYPVAVERGWMSRSDATARTLAALRFFANSDQGDHHNATGYKGLYYHFLDVRTGARTWQCEVSLIDSALLLAGALTASTYFSQATASERELRWLAEALFRRADWGWALDGSGALAHGWKPECGFLHYGWQGYNEATILYVLGLASPDHPVPAASYGAWSSTFQWENLYGQDVLYAGPLFVHQFSHAWIDFRGIQDGFMREKASDYFENSRRSVEVQRAYASLNPLGFKGYSDVCWGLSACVGPDAVTSGTRVGRGKFGYAARGVPYGPDDGTLSAPATVACIPFAPEQTVAALRALYECNPDVVRGNQLPSGFNPGFKGGWASEGRLGLDQGIVVLMIENHRSGWLWSLMRGCPYIRNGLHRAGFTGGWLA